MDLSTQRPCRAPLFWRFGAGLVFAAALPGCKREEIHVYTVPKEQSAQMAGGSEGKTETGTPHVHFTTPSGWTEEQAGGIRVARFSVPAKQGPQIDVSVIPLPGITASKTDIVNLWREQIRLAPIQEAELDGAIEKVSIGSDQAEMFDMVSTNAIIEDKHKARILVAMLNQGQTTWFFKMTGEDQSVSEQKPAFVEFLKSVAIDYSSHADAVPRVTSGAPSRPSWQVPASWKEVPPPQMLLAKFVMPDSNQPKAEVTVSVFPGDAGGLLPNINRWRRQLKLEPVQDGALEKMTASLDLPGGKAILVDMSGQNPTNGQPSRIIGAILSKGEQTWFYKLMGEEQLAEREKETFIKFVQTATYPNG